MLQQGSNRQPGQGRAQSVGQVSGEPLTWTAPNKVSVGAASGALVAAGTGTGRTVQLKVPTTATVGVHVNLAGGAATTNMMLIEPGETREYATETAINAIRGGSSDVDVYVAVGTVA